MFLALRALAFQRSRFLLVGLVIGLLALLTVMLSGLSSGLVNDGVSGLKNLPATAMAFSAGTKTDNAFSQSVVDEKQRAAWAGRPHVADAQLLGVSIVNTRKADATPVDLTLFGVAPDSFLAPTVDGRPALTQPGDVVLSATARKTGVRAGDVLTLDRVGTTLRVVGFTAQQDTFGHVDVGYLPLRTWQYIASGRSAAGAPTADAIAADALDTASVVALRSDTGSTLATSGIDVAAGDQAADTTTRSLQATFASSPGYTAETTTISMITAFLYVIAALVIGAFFTVWTVQRQHELAVLRAVGAPTGFLLRDGLTQAAALLVTFTAVGAGIGLGLGALIPDGVPFALEAAPVAGAAVLMITLGLVGAGLAVLRIARIDPLTALGGQR
ncbi:putative ABC transporter permease [Cellulomonas sp. T2.31MG-18]|uniref:ABC transporter permease n=1 Tax=Cellulomonas sp. T2.31MG-18 TaxID=3157619 RepID=UPI0035E93B3F